MSEITTNSPVSKEKGINNRPQRKARGKVVIFASWCKGCRLCVEFCPTGVLAIGADELAYVAHPENCTACHWCDTHCPDLAIIVESIEE